MCPYFLARQLLNQSNIIVYNYLYMLDAKMTEILDKVMIPMSFRYRITPLYRSYEFIVKGYVEGLHCHI